VKQHEPARRHLMKCDPVLAGAIRAAGACRLETDTDSFGVLARSILSQQISTKAAQTITGRVVTACGRGGLKPSNIRKLDDATFRTAGVSANKVLSLRSLSDYFVEHAKLLKTLPDLPDDEVVKILLPVRGIGVWTAQMFLMFSLGRPDVLPVADLGFQTGVKTLYGLAALPTSAELTALAEPWRPYRSIGTWYIWHMHDAK
jgi:DNA-3-methyladenine glycosylase II